MVVIRVVLSTIMSTVIMTTIVKEQTITHAQSLYTGSLLLDRRLAAL
jgi:hypothetical protein